MKRAVTTNKRVEEVADLLCGQCCAGRVRIINRVVTSIYDDALRPLGLKVTQMGILVAIGKLGEPSSGELLRWLQMEKSTLSRNVERMSKRGWVAVRPGKDGRSMAFKVTARGGKLMERAVPRWQEAQKQTQALLGAKGEKALFEIAERIGRRGQRG